MQVAVRVDRVTVVGLALLLMPLLTMWHEIGGHAAMCLATGHRVIELGAFYVDCDTQGGTAAARWVAVAGAGMDVLGGLLLAWLWGRLKGDLVRLACWYAWVSLVFNGTGYLLFSGVAGIGDLSPIDGGGIGPLPQPWLWRAVFAVAGGLLYFLWAVKAGSRQLAAMIGQGPETKSARRTIAHLFYAVVCISAVLASIPNPVGVFITLASAAAATVGGKAGFISIGYATEDAGSARGFVIERNWALLLVGVAASAAFAAVLGPTLRFG